MDQCQRTLSVAFLSLFPLSSLTLRSFPPVQHGPVEQTPGRGGNGVARAVPDRGDPSWALSNIQVGIYAGISIIFKFLFFFFFF